MQDLRQDKPNINQRLRRDDSATLWMQSHAFGRLDRVRQLHRRKHLYVRWIMADVCAEDYRS